jgi:hypothetical protein
MVVVAPGSGNRFHPQNIILTARTVGHDQGIVRLASSWSRVGTSRCQIRSCNRDGDVIAVAHPVARAIA